MIIALNCARQRFLHTPPVALLEPVEAEDRGRSARVDPAVEGLVTPSRLLLSGAPRETLDDPGDQPLGRELLEVLREVVGAGRVSPTPASTLRRSTNAPGTERTP
jgi:hypothetical protein